jgi:hypothetical protein
MVWRKQEALAVLTDPSAGIARPQVSESDLHAQTSARIGFEPLQEIGGAQLEVS